MGGATLVASLTFFSGPGYLLRPIFAETAPNLFSFVGLPVQVLS